MGGDCIIKWGNAVEKEFIRSLPPEKLEPYYHALQQRTNWGCMDKEKILAFTENIIAKTKGRITDAV